jgi:plastocyanin
MEQETQNNAPSDEPAENKVVKKTSDRKGFPLFTILIIVVVFIAGIMWLRENKSDNKQSNNSNESSQNADNADGNQKQNVNVKTFDITAKPFEFSVKEIKVKKGDRVRINFTNVQGFHDLVIDEFKVRTKQLTAGNSETIEFTADKVGTFEYYCSVANHRQMGMVGKLIVE